MKNISLIMLLLGLQIASGNAQNTNPNGNKKTSTPCDTVAPGQVACLDPDVIQFSVTIISNGIIVENNSVRGACYLEGRNYRSGTVVFCEEIIASPQAGMLVKRPARKFYFQ